jgi:hypothetical protein
METEKINLLLRPQFDCRCKYAPFLNLEIFSLNGGIEAIVTS